jgi:MFS superfamily sulfate permease-like transporter
MPMPQAVLGLTIATLAGLAVLLVGVIIWISLRFYNENARITQETSELHARMGETMTQVLSLTHVTNERALTYLEQSSQVVPMTQQEIARQVREETQKVVTEATAQICDSVERVMSSLLKEIAAQMGPRRNVDTPELQANVRPLAEGHPGDGVVDYQYVDGWDVIRWHGQINSQTYERVARATCEILSDLGDQGERRVLLDLTQVPLISAGAAAAVAEVRTHARDMRQTLRLISGARQRSQELAQFLGSNGDGGHVFDSRETALAA